MRKNWILVTIIIAWCWVLALVWVQREGETLSLVPPSAILILVLIQTPRKAVSPPSGLWPDEGWLNFHHIHSFPEDGHNSQVVFWRKDKLLRRTKFFKVLLWQWNIPTKLFWNWTTDFLFTNFTKRDENI